MQQQIYTPVLIAGGGPVGLSLAFDLAWRGVPNMLLESTDGAIHHPKTGHIAIRTMEYCRRWGLAERVRNSGFPLSPGFLSGNAGQRFRDTQQGLSRHFSI